MISTEIKLAAKLLSEQEIIGLPTETVYGLAGNAFSEPAIQSIYKIKNRPFYNPLIVHIGSARDLPNVASIITEKAKILADLFWPGPLTLLLPKNANIPDLVTAGSPQVAVRVPNHPMALELLAAINFPLVAPSANPFGRISPTSAKHVYNYFKDEVKLVLDGGICQRGIESTIIGFNNDTPILYRYGAIPLEEIEKAIGKVEIYIKNNKNPEGPGMTSVHYAPKTKVYLTDDIMGCIAENPNKRIGVLSFSQKFEHPQINHQIILSELANMEEAAANLYSALHQLDSTNTDIIIAQRMPEIGLGNSINDRLQRATKN